MNFQSERRARGTVVLEVTPLVDIVFLLLIFFLLTATYVKNPNIDISLPKASLKQVTQHQKDIVVAIKENGKILYGNEPVDLDDLEGLLSARYSESQDAVVVIRADKASRHGRVVEVMDLAKKVGFGRLAIAIEGKSAVEP